MRNIIVLGVLVFSMAIAYPTHAQSDSRGGSGARSSGGGRAVSSGGGGRRAVSGGGGSGSRRLSRVERQRLAQQEAELRQEQAQEAARLQEAQSKREFKQSLTQLADSDNRAANSRQNRYALAQARKDFKSLRRMQVAPSLLGPLEQPFRLTQEEIDRENFTLNWPTALQGDEFEALLEVVDAAIMNRTVNDTESATQFLDDLAQLNTTLNVAAVDGEIEIKDYAKARRFVTGLANEVRASDLVM